MDDKQKEKFIKECRSWLGTRWQHAVSLKGVGVDCVQFMLSVSKKMGWLNKNFKVKPYPRDWALHQSHSILMDWLNENCNKVNVHFVEAGDILVYKFNRCNSHVAYYIGDRKAIHSHIVHGVVEYDIYEPVFRKKLTHAVRWKGDI